MCVTHGVSLSVHNEGVRGHASRRKYKSLKIDGNKEEISASTDFPDLK